ncbi:hypothetical protein BDV12DRAFT_84795 [Aspergillus spectabilis]
METAMEEYLDTPLCRKWALSRVLDGEPQPCDDDKLLCDQCEKHDWPQVPTSPAAEVVDPSSNMAEPPEPEAEAEQVEEQGEQDHQEVMQRAANAVYQQQQSYTCGLADYTQSLQSWRGTCMICYHLPGAASGCSGHARHTLNDYQNPARFKYFDAKKKATRQGREQ